MLQTLGRYELTSLVGAGGMATVYRAVDPVLKRDVAIKVMHPHLAADSAFVGRFKHEAQAVAALRHPNIVKVYDFGNEGDSYYMVMEFVDGPTLSALLGAPGARDIGACPPTRPAAACYRPGRSCGFSCRCAPVDYAIPGYGPPISSRPTS